MTWNVCCNFFFKWIKLVRKMVYIGYIAPTNSFQRVCFFSISKLKVHINYTEILHLHLAYSLPFIRTSTTTSSTRKNVSSKCVSFVISSPFTHANELIKTYVSWWSIHFSLNGIDSVSIRIERCQCYFYCLKVKNSRAISNHFNIWLRRSFGKCNDVFI